MSGKPTGSAYQKGVVFCSFALWPAGTRPYIVSTVFANIRLLGECR
jgi:hypothetical protein